MKYIMNVENAAEAIKQTYDVLYYIKPLGSMKIITTPRYTAIDLGLPSGLKWANMNIGAEKETDYGKYFQWGDTIGYTDASHSTADTYPGGGDSDSLAAWDAANLNVGMTNSTKNLKPEVDAATTNMGSNWRMPTYEDCSELYLNTNYEYAEINGVKGGKFVNKTDVSKYIFLPFAGVVADGSFENQGTIGAIWSGSISFGSSDVYIVGGVESGIVDGALNRYFALPVRGVC